MVRTSIITAVILTVLSGIQTFAQERGSREKADKPRVVETSQVDEKVQVDKEAQTENEVDLEKLTPVEEGAMVLKKVPEVTEERPMSFWMRHKLEYSKRILETLTMGDHEKVALYARQLRTLGKIEGFVRRKNPDYRKQQQMFDASLASLIYHAEQPDATQATLAFSKLASTCVNCHTLLRGETAAINSVADPTNTSPPANEPDRGPDPTAEKSSGTDAGATGDGNK